MVKVRNLNFLLIFSILLITATSGCTFPGGGGTAGGQGVVIENFEVDFPQVYAGENFKLQMRLRNDGSVDAYNVYPKLYNIGTNVGDSSLEVSCQPTCEQGIKLLAPDPDRGTIGESRTCIWDCIAPTDIPKGLSTTFNPSARLYYLYETHTIKSVTIVSQNELRSLESQGNSLPSETISTTGGPVSLDVVVQGPIRYWEGEQRIVFPININLRNNGGGVVCMDKDTYIPGGFGTIPFIPVIPTFINVVVVGCENPDYWNKAVLYFDESVKITCGSQVQDVYELQLWKGQSTTLTCEVEMQVPTELTTGFIQKNLKFSVYYAYLLDRTVNVEVVGRDIPVY